jgi:hypothetical protein
MNIGIGNEAAQFHFWEYINWILGTVQYNNSPATPISVTYNFVKKVVHLRSLLTMQP